MRAGPVIMLVLAALHAAPGRAEPVSVRLELDARPDCATREQLVARVRARSDRIQFEDDGPGLIRASVTPGAGMRTSVTGALSVEQPDGRATERRILAPSCEQATDALALLIVLALDPAAATSAAPPPRPESPRPLPPAIAVAPPALPAPSPPPRTGWGVEAGGWIVVGPAPRPMPGISVGGTLTRDRPGLWSPALAVSLLHAGSGDLSEPGGTAAFTLDVAILDACPMRVAVSAFQVRACASAQVGRLAASGSNTYAPATLDRPFAAAGASLRLAVSLSRHLQLGGRLAAEAPWRRDAFAFSPVVFHRVAAVVVAAGLSLGLRFP